MFERRTAAAQHAVRLLATGAFDSRHIDFGYPPKVLAMSMKRCCSAVASGRFSLSRERSWARYHHNFCCRGKRFFRQEGLLPRLSQSSVCRRPITLRAQSDKTSDKRRTYRDRGQDCKALAKALVADQAIPQQFPEDALHIAIAAVHRVDVIVTWNFKHINNPATRGKIRQSIERQGYSCPEICSPDEFMGGEDG